MAKPSLHDRFEAMNEEYLHFERIESPRHPRRDICAFLMLHDLNPGDHGVMVSADNHDEIWLRVEPHFLEWVSDGVLRDLIRCGVSYSKGEESLYMFV